MKIKALKNVRTYDFYRYQEGQYILFRDRILETGPMAQFQEALSRSLKDGEEPEVLEGGGGLVLPGLVLCHTHIYSTFARGMSLPFHPENFLQVLEQLWWKMDAALDNDLIYHSALVSAMGYIRHGVSSVIDHHASGKDISGTLEELRRAVVADFGLRGAFCFETSDRFDLDRCIEENLSFSAKHPGHFGMHASMTLSDASLEKISRVLGNTPIHIHAAESIMDQEDSRKKYGLPVLERLDRFNLLNPGSLIVHGAYLNEKEMDLIRERGCYLVLNPSSNMNNGVGLPDYRKLKEHDVPCLLGNDGMGPSLANEWQALLFGMHHRYGDPLGFSLDDLLQIIRNSYHYASGLWDLPLGRLEEDYAADFMLLDYDPPTPMDESNALGHLFYGLAMSLRPSHFWCRGVEKMSHYRVKGEDPALLAECRSRAVALWKELNRS